MRRFTLVRCAFVLSRSLGWSPLVRADAVTDWNASVAKAVSLCVLDSTNRGCTR